jgi:hypothetical protein
VTGTWSAIVVPLMRLMPFWSKLKAVAHTLPNDLTLMAPYQRGVPFEPGQWSSVTADTIVIDGGKSPTWMRNGNKAGADAIPGAEYKTLSGQTHNVKAKALTPALLEFFS